MAGCFLELGDELLDRSLQRSGAEERYICGVRRDGAGNLRDVEHAFLVLLDEQILQRVPDPLGSRRGAGLPGGIELAQFREEMVVEGIDSAAEGLQFIDDFLAALDHGLPPCSGIALGFDRLVMLATGATHIEDVLWLPVR